MLGLLTTLIFTGLVCLGGAAVLSRLFPDLDPAERFGLGGIIGLGLMGTVIGLVGYLNLNLGLGLAMLMVVAGVVSSARSGDWKSAGFSLPKTGGLAATAFLILMLVFPTVGVLAPSSTMDWDSIAYHLADPKIWIQTGAAQPMPWEHHSFFPGAVDALYVPGLIWGGQAGAKGFELAFLVLGCVWVFGAARRVVGGDGAWWAPIVLAGSPVVLWEAGTAYIDVPHGLFCGAAIWYLAELGWKAKEGEVSFGKGFSGVPGIAWIGGMCLALGLGSKYTGLQAAIAAGFCHVFANIKRPQSQMKGVVPLTLCVVVIAGGWYVRNFAVTGNPVYPFFDSIFHGKYWGKWQADTYANEQQSFGVGRTEKGRDPVQIGNGVLGLAYQPGRFTNPSQATGGGFPSGAVGAACLLALFVAAVSGKLSFREKAVLGWVGLMLLMWFFLSQQSRYMTYLCVAGALLLPVVMSRWRPFGTVAAGVAVLQGFYCVWMLYSTQAQLQLLPVVGSATEAEYLKKTTPFAVAAAEMNEDSSVTTVAMFDEVFGFYLDKPYYWANPGHSTLNDFGSMESGADLVKGLWDSPSHVYFSLQYMDKGAQEKWLSAAGLIPGDGYSEDEKAEMMGDLNLRWHWLLADAVKSGGLRVEKAYGFGLVMRVVR